MTEIKKKVKLELVGLDGNAFALMGAFKKAAREQGWSKEEIDAVLDPLKLGDYNNLLCGLIENTESPELSSDDDDDDDEDDEDDDDDDEDDDEDEDEDEEDDQG